MTVVRLQVKMGKIITYLQFKLLTKLFMHSIVIHPSSYYIQFISKEFTRFCLSLGISQIMSRADTSYDKAPIEQYYNTLKAEKVCQRRYDTIDEFDQSINEFAYVWYKQIRPHFYNNYLTPLEKRLK